MDIRNQFIISFLKGDLSTNLATVLSPFIAICLFTDYRACRHQLSHLCQQAGTIAAESLKNITPSLTIF